MHISPHYQQPHGVGVGKNPKIQEPPLAPHPHPQSTAYMGVHSSELASYSWFSSPSAVERQRHHHAGGNQGPVHQIGVYSEGP